MSVRTIMRSILQKVAPTVAHARYIRYMTPQEPEISLLPIMCRNQLMAIDVGANLGLYVHYLLRLTNDVVAFEPLPPMQRTLHKIYGDRIRLESIALSDASGMAQLKFPEGNYAWATLESSNNLSLSGTHHIITQTVKLRTLDSYGFKNVGILKIDVEGHEEAVIVGGTETIKGSRPFLIVEIEERHKKGAIKRIIERMSDIEYNAFFIAENEIHDISEFDLERDQPLSNIDCTGKLSRYINNFIFAPRDRAREFCTEASVLLQA